MRRAEWTGIDVGGVLLGGMLYIKTMGLVHFDLGTEQFILTFVFTGCVLFYLMLN